LFANLIILYDLRFKFVVYQDLNKLFKFQYDFNL